VTPTYVQRRTYADGSSTIPWDLNSATGAQLSASVGLEADPLNESQVAAVREQMMRGRRRGMTDLGHNA
jgi:hypothetical protein